MNSILPSDDWVDPKRKVTVTEKTLRRVAGLHMHDFFEIELVVGGHGTQNLNGSMYELKRGVLYFLSPVDFHSVTPEKELDLINISLAHNAVSPELLNTLINHSENLIIQLSEHELAQFELWKELLCEDGSAGDAASGLYTKNLLECLLIWIMRKDNLSHDSKPGKDSLPMYRCMRHLFLHFNESPSLNEMAKTGGYSASYFSKLFHEATGKIYVDFLTDLKLNYARMLLASTKESIISIASDCGFTSLSNFNRSFRKKTGMSPTQYRKQNSG